MNCPNCQHTNIDGASFCGNCGNSLASTVQPQISSLPQATSEPVVTVSGTAPIAIHQSPSAPQPPVQPAITTQPTVAQPLPTQAAPLTPKLQSVAPLPQPAVASPQINTPVSNSSVPIKDRVKQVKWFSVSALLVGGIYGSIFAFYAYLYISDILFAQTTLSSLDGDIPLSVLVTVIVVTVTASVLTFIAGLIAQKAKSVKKARIALVFGGISTLLIAIITWIPIGFGALICTILATVAYLSLKKLNL